LIAGAEELVSSKAEMKGPTAEAVSIFCLLFSSLKAAAPSDLREAGAAKWVFRTG
jgi:hypothetical protein